MNWLHTQMTMLDAATGTVGFGVNWFLQSTLLLAVGLVVGWLLKRRGSAVQSVVYRTTLVAVLGCPIASWTLALAGVSGWSVAMPRAWTYRQTMAPVMESEPSITEPAPAVVLSDPVPALRAEPPIAADERAMVEAPIASVPPPPFIEADNSEPPSAAREPEVEEAAVTVPAELWLFSVDDSA